MKFEGEVPDCNPLQLPKFLNGEWHFPTQMGVAPYVGFIYLIRDNYMRKFYLGKKTFRGTGAKNKGLELNWRTYQSSSKIVKHMVTNRPREEFDFICIEQYKTKGGLSYAETWTLCFVEAPTKESWYNKRVEAVSWSVREGITAMHKERLQDALQFKEFNER